MRSKLATHATHSVNPMKVDHLESDGPLTEYDYEYLRGNTAFWPSWGAALAVTMEWCSNHRYGSFGEPTERGKAAMRHFEQTQVSVYDWHDPADFI